MITSFERRAVAFLDILGFKELIARAESEPSEFAKLSDLRNIVDSHVQFDNAKLAAAIPASIRPRYLFVSDSIIISSKLTEDTYDGLLAVAIKAIQIAHKMLEAGYLLRGGISVGSVWHDDRNIFGTGYIDAYRAEQRAMHPRVILTDVALDHSRTATIGGDPMSNWGLFGNHEGAVVLEALHPAYVSDLQRSNRIENVFSQYRNHILKSLSAMPLGSPERSKWEWMAGFFNRAITRHGLNAQEFKELPVPTV